MTNVLVTGANGFVGSALVLKIAEAETGVIRIAVRKSTRLFPKRVEIFENLELAESTDWTAALSTHWRRLPRRSASKECL